MTKRLAMNNVNIDQNCCGYPARYVVLETRNFLVYQRCIIVYFSQESKILNHKKFTYRKKKKKSVVILIWKA